MIADPSVLDAAHAAMEASPDDDALRLAYYARLADSLLWLWLEREAAGGDVAPQVFPTGDGPVVLAFDSEERMAAATGDAVPYAALPGRVIARALAGQGVALGINLGTGAAEMLLPPAALDWLTGTLDLAPEAVEARPAAFAPPDLPAGLVSALLRGLSGPQAPAAALLAAVRYDDGRAGHLLALVEAPESARPALAQAVAEAVALAQGGAVDVLFVDRQARVLRAMEGAAQRLDLTPPPVAPPAAPPAAPGMQPGKPPRLR